MPSVSFDTKVETDPRFYKLVELVGSREIAFGILLHAVREAYPFWKHYNPIPEFTWVIHFPKGDELIQSGFAERLASGGFLLKNMRDIYAYESDEERERNNYI